jgi:hypothetical protein
MPQRANASHRRGLVQGSGSKTGMITLSRFEHTRSKTPHSAPRASRTSVPMQGSTLDVALHQRVKDRSGTTSMARDSVYVSARVLEPAAGRRAHRSRPWVTRSHAALS